MYDNGVRADAANLFTKLMQTSRQTFDALHFAAAGRNGPAGRTLLQESAAARNRPQFEAVLERHSQKQSAPDHAATQPEPEWRIHTVRPGETVWGLAVRRYHVNVSDMLADNNIQDPKKLQPGQKLKVRIPSYPEKQQVVASWYGEDYHGKPMANGEAYDMHQNTIAHKELPLGTVVDLYNPETGQSARAVVKDRGPFVAGRDVDLSFGLAKKLSIYQPGVGKLLMRVVG